MNFALRKCFQVILIPNLNKSHCRHYARLPIRRPLKVIAPDQYDEVEDKAFKNEKLKEEVKIKWRYKTEKALEETEDEEIERVQQKPNKKHKGVMKTAKPEVTDMLETIIDAEGNFVYTKMANNDPRVGIILTTIKSKKEKTKKDLILLEGKRLIKDALDGGCKLKYLIFSRKDELEFLKPSLPKFGAQLYKMPYREIMMWSNLTTSPGIMGIFKTPEVDKYEPKNWIPLTIVCDNIREPGNLGSILRSAAGVGCKKVILTKGCVALWDSKVTRSAAGSHFHVQIEDKVTINDIKKTLTEKSRCFLADNKIISGLPDDASNYEATEVIQSLPIIPYYSISCHKDDEIILIIGGETNGISYDSYKLAKEFNGIRLNIPLTNGVESLNAGTALGIISFEIRKQLSITNSNYVNKLAETDVSLGLRFL